MPTDATLSSARIAVAAVAEVWADNKGVSFSVLTVLSAVAGPAFTDSGSCRPPATKAVARAWELGCETIAPLPARNGCDGAAVSMTRKRSFPRAVLTPTTIVRVRRDRV